ncbi:hypothetical protein CAPTEDRAFT_188101 [Capitella teleta]|uniref:G-protein coupled receptors family 1 profile domain-containing protein n=2 Tax=Capitella teleta TaxID=283909 RepID=R7TID9_CAPTE|nr:hypothetical protein CAPTEDRAFT_188101 [Capitella teleta]|eukprot:ELT90835.1 hypothetical protein CAPTEDRAFT_188101 [Capitella teleta]
MGTLPFIYQRQKNCLNRVLEYEGESCPKGPRSNSGNKNTNKEQSSDCSALISSGAHGSRSRKGIASTTRCSALGRKLRTQTPPVQDLSSLWIFNFAIFQRHKCFLKTKIMETTLELCKRHRSKTINHTVSDVMLTNISSVTYDLEGTLMTSAPPTQAPPSGSPYWFRIVIPIVCIVGIVGNLLNLFVLTRRRLLSSMQRLERCATYGLTALALSDMLFCLTVLPNTLEFPTSVFSLYYRVYGIAFIHLFIMLSNWLTVVIAINRFLVVMYPIHARHFLGSTKTLASIAMVTIFSVVVTLTYFLHTKVSRCLDSQGREELEHRIIYPAIDGHVTLYNRWVWPAIGVFIPVLLLAIFNFCLIREIKTAAQYRRSSSCRSQAKDTSHKVTLTLVSIVLMLFLLCVPSEVIKYINPYSAWGPLGYTVAYVVNALQAANFALNFFLYCVVNPYFRRTIADTFCGRCVSSSLLHSQNSSNESRSLNGNRSCTKTVNIQLNDSFKASKAPRCNSIPRNNGKYVQPLTAL